MSACPFCGGAMRPWLEVPGDWRRPESQERYTLYWCDADVFGQLFPRPSPEAVAAFYEVDEYYTHHQAQPGTSNTSTFSERLRTHLAWRFDQGQPLTAEAVHAQLHARPARICDIGCGAGEFIAELQSLGHEVLGVEPDPAARAVAESRGVHVLPGLAEALPEELPERHFDVVILSHVLEHCLDPLAALAAAAARLRPGGRLFCETPNNAAEGLRRAGPCWHWLDVPRHLNFFTAHSLRLACERAGLRVEAARFTGYHRQFTRDWIEAERYIHTQLKAAGGHTLPRNSPARAWRLLLRSGFSSKKRKYDSVRVEAVNPHASSQSE